MGGGGAVGGDPPRPPQETLSCWRHRRTASQLSTSFFFWGGAIPLSVGALDPEPQSSQCYVGTGPRAFLKEGGVGGGGAVWGTPPPHQETLSCWRRRMFWPKLTCAEGTRKKILIGRRPGEKFAPSLKRGGGVRPPPLCDTPSGCCSFTLSFRPPGGDAEL